MALLTHTLPQDRLPRGTLAAFFCLTWLHTLWLTHAYFAGGSGAPGSSLELLFHAAAWPCYSLIYLLPALGVTALCAGLRPGGSMLPPIAGVLSSALALLLIRADSIVYDLYAFHINSFVLNLVFTPGGLASLGSGAESFASIALVSLRILLVQAGLMLLAVRLARRAPWFARRRPWLALLGLFLGLFTLQGAVYGLSDASNVGAVLDSADAYPLFQRVRFRSLARRFGFEHARRPGLAMRVSSTALNYPRAPVRFRASQSTPNIIVLVAESLRWDQLNPETMPHTWQFSARALRFTRHYSSGNGTREALFGMFYGLYGAYWESFMHARRSPLLMDRLQQLGYQLDIRTSASFTYPEFDRTLFLNVPDAALHTADPKLPAWRRDELNTDALLSFLDSRDAGRPFLQFFFLESTHAGYSFPESQALTPDYQRSLDYASLSRARLAAGIVPLYNRYRNAAHWIDRQLGRIYAGLEQRGLLDDTIVIVTGDHGEEFMEKGAWGHNSAFVEEQTHVPLVVRMPGQPAAVIDRLTGHADIATTLLQTLGAERDAGAYSLGRNLLDAHGSDYLVMSDWHSIAVMTPELKYRIPYLSIAGANYWAPTDQQDRPLSRMEAEQLTSRYRGLLLKAMSDCSVFSRRSPAPERPAAPPPRALDVL